MVAAAAAALWHREIGEGAERIWALVRHGAPDETAGWGGGAAHVQERVRISHWGWWVVLIPLGLAVGRDARAAVAGIPAALAASALGARGLMF